MEENKIDFFYNHIIQKEQFEYDLKNDNILNLAYIGDAIFDFLSRDYIIKRYCKVLKINEINEKNVFFVKASNQAYIVDILIDNKFLTDDEILIYKRGRNAHTKKRIKSATMVDYRKATGFEAVIGFLYYNKKIDRIYEITNKYFEILDK